MSATRTQTATQKSKPRVKSSEDGSKGIWSSLLDSVASGKRLAEKNVIVLGGSPSSQKDFLDTLAQDATQRRTARDRTHARRAPVANRFALGYSYQDIFDADHDDTLARLSLYLLATPHPSFAPLLEPLFTPQTIPNTLVIVLLDWAHPWTWLRDLQGWLRILRSVLSSLDSDCQAALDENTKEWSERRRGPAAEGAVPAGADAGTPGPGLGSEVTLPLGAGEYDEPIGIPLCVVAQGAEKIETFEREHSWRDDEFDTVLQYLRTVLLKHGASLIYIPTAASSSAAVAAAAGSGGAAGSGPTASPNTQVASLQSLIRGSLGINSLLQKNALRHNLIDRDRIVVPPNWDSWGKIRVLREGFDVEGTSDAWAFDIQTPRVRVNSNGEDAPHGREENADIQNNTTTESDPQSPSAVASYEKAVQNPAPPKQASGQSRDQVEVSCPSNQEFFTEQNRILDRLKVDDEAEQRKQDAKRVGGSSTGTSTPGLAASAVGRVSEHIGPVQFNMGGIQVDANDALKSMRAPGAGPASPSGLQSPVLSNGRSTPALDERGEAMPISSAISAGGDENGTAAGDGVPDEKAKNEELKSFFAGLMSRGASSNGGRSAA